MGLIWEGGELGEQELEREPGGPASRGNWRSAARGAAPPKEASSPEAPGDPLPRAACRSRVTWRTQAFSPIGPGPAA